MSGCDAGDDHAALDDWLSAFDAEPQPLAPLLRMLDDDTEALGWRTLTDDTTSIPSDASRSSTDRPGAVATTAKRPYRRRPSGADMNRIALNALRIQVRELASALDLLRVDHFGATPSHAAHNAFDERRRRHRAERECERLRAAVATQTRFLHSLRSALMPCAPVSANALLFPELFRRGDANVAIIDLCLAHKVDLYHFLHRYTRLPREHSVRLAEYASLADESRLHTAKDLLVRETAPIIAASVATPFIQTELTLASNGCAVATRAVYAFDTRDVDAVVRGVGTAVADMVPKCLAYKTMTLSRKVVGVAPKATTARRLASTNLSYCVMGVRHQSLGHDGGSSPDELSIESRVVVQAKRTDLAIESEPDSEAVVLWDFVDDDELHPAADDVDITRQCIGACVVRREICDDGVDRVVYRSMSSRVYRFHGDPTLGAFVRFVGITEGAMKTHELLFRAMVAEQLAVNA